MSSETDDNGGLDAIKGPKVNTTQIHDLTNVQRPRQGAYYPGQGILGSGFRGYAAQLGSQYDGERQLYDALGYTKTLKIQHYVAKYERGPGIARGIVDKPVHDCWGDVPEVLEADETEGETDFEKEARRFLNGDYTRVKPSVRFRNAHRWARLLEFSLILIGVSDENVTGGEPNSLENEVATDSIDSLDDIDYLAVYDQRRISWDETDFVDDPTDARYNLPEKYSIDVGRDDGNIKVHHSRIIHTVEGPDSDELRSDPIYKPIFNRLEDLQKLLGGSAEMFWRAAYPGLVLTPPTDADGVPMRFDDDGESVAHQIAKYRQNLDRMMRVTGNLEKLETDVAEPDKHVAVQIEDISAHVDIPMSMIRGNETGERATTEDKQMYAEFIARLQREYCVEQVLEKIFDRFLDWGVMTPTESGDENRNSYEIEFPTFEEPSEKEMAETAEIWARAFNTISGGEPETVASVAERRKVGLGISEEYGSEAPDAADPEALAADNLEVGEDE